MRIAYLYHNGYKISKLAQMSETEVIRLSLEQPTGHNDYYQLQVNQLVEAMIDFDQSKFEKIFHSVLLRIGFEQCILQVIYPYLEKVGLLWLTGSVVPAQEHFATNIIRKKILVAIDGLELSNEGDKNFLLFLPDGEYHEIPLLFSQYLLRNKGVNLVNLGPSVPLEDIVFYSSRKKVTHFYTHIITQHGKKEMDNFVQEMSTHFPSASIIISGPAVANISTPAPANVVLLKSLNEILQFIQAVS